jgi:sigma-70-like protein/uncharacterized protein DUF6596
VGDERLRLIFTCCHPALSAEAQVALTLRLLGGLSTRQVAGSFLVSEATMAARLVRAKRKIKAARIPYRVPQAHELPDRLHSVLAVVYLIYNAGSTSLAEPDLCVEAIRLTRVLVALMSPVTQLVSTGRWRAGWALGPQHRPPRVRNRPTHMAGMVGGVICYLAGRLRAYATPRPTQRRRSPSSAQPSAATMSQPFIGRPVRSNGWTPGSVSSASC